jgi:hypothetical protein
MANTIPPASAGRSQASGRPAAGLSELMGMLMMSLRSLRSTRGGGPKPSIARRASRAKWATPRISGKLSGTARNGCCVRGRRRMMAASGTRLRAQRTRASAQARILARATRTLARRAGRLAGCRRVDRGRCPPKRCTPPPSVQRSARLQPRRVTALQRPPVIPSVANDPWRLWRSRQETRGAA